MTPHPQDSVMQVTTANVPHRVFAIHELVVHIAKNLSPSDVSQWTMTCKTFACQLEPVFWSRLVIRRDGLDVNTLSQYRGYIRSLQVYRTSVPQFLEIMVKALPPSPTITSSDGFPRLETLTLLMGPDRFDARYSIPQLVLVFGHCRNLAQFTISANILDQGSHFLQNFLHAMDISPSLRHLFVTGGWMKDEAGSQLTKGCLSLPQLVELKLEFKMDAIHIVRDHSLEYLNGVVKSKSASCGGGGEPASFRLRSLMLPEVVQGYPRDFLFSLFTSKMDKVEDLVLPIGYEDIDGTHVDEIEAAIATGCPRLQRLSALYSWDDRDADGHHGLINDIVRGCGLRYFHARFFNDAFITSELDPISVLIQNHASTLEELDLPSLSLKSASIQSILTRCKNLRALRVESYGSLSVSISLGDAALNEWACCHITVLQLCLDRRVHNPEGARAQDIDAQAAQRVYAQLGRLIKLEELSLSYDTSLFEDASIVDGDFTTDLTLEYGWLAELAGLKNLKHFRMEADFWSFMGLPEVEFMATNWLRLKSIGFARSDWGTVVRGPHWQWLKRERPHLAYVCRVSRRDVIKP